MNKGASKSSTARVKQNAWARRQKAGLAARIKICGAMAARLSEQMAAILAERLTAAQMRAALARGPQEVTFIAEKFNELAELIKSDRIDIKRRRGAPLSKKEEMLGLAEANVRNHRRELRDIKKRGDELPKVAVGFDAAGKPIWKPLTDDLMIEAQVRIWGDLFSIDELEAQLAGERRSKFRHRKAAKRAGRK